MQLFLIRHAESANNARPPYERVEDPAITAVGRMQAQHLADWTRTLKIDTLITSPFLRTIETTLQVVQGTRQQVNIWHDVFERGGCYRGHKVGEIHGAMGLGRSAIQRHFQENAIDCLIDDTIEEKGWWGGRPQETEEEVAMRAQQVTQRLIDAFGTSQRNIVVVIHADFKRWLLRVMMGGAVDTDSFGPLRNTGISKLNFDGSRWQLDWLNSVSHLPARLITGNEH
tara:strand:- start:223080 stop:223760 length:681 start_codon:yes stop_codon:yes gene_type:complete